MARRCPNQQLRTRMRRTREWSGCTLRLAVVRISVDPKYDHDLRNDRHTADGSWTTSSSCSAMSIFGSAEFEELRS